MAVTPTKHIPRPEMEARIVSMDVAELDVSEDFVSVALEAEDGQTMFGTFHVDMIGHLRAVLQDGLDFANDLRAKSGRDSVAPVMTGPPGMVHTVEMAPGPDGVLLRLRLPDGTDAPFLLATEGLQNLADLALDTLAAVRLQGV